MRCLVLGGAGFIGSHLCKALADEGVDVVSFQRCSSKEFNYKGVTTFYGDFSNVSDIDAALDGVDLVYHLISTTVPASSNLDPVFDIESNLVPTVRLLEVMRRKSVKRVVFVSSGGTVYGVPEVTPMNEEHPCNPISSYGVCKLAIENYIRMYTDLYGIESIILRVSNPFGRNQSYKKMQGVVGFFVNKALNHEFIEVWGDGSVVRDFIHIDDLVSAMLLCLIFKDSCLTVNIGSGIGVSLNELIGKIESVSGRSINVCYKPKREFDIPAVVLDITCAKNKLEWAPRNSLEKYLKNVFKG